MKTLFLTLLFALIPPLLAAAQSPSPEAQIEAPASPKAPWLTTEPGGDPLIAAESESEFTWVDALLWLPNRVMDFVDIFRFDIGFGPSRGGVLRLTKYAQAGYREMAPASMRIGFLGRRAPYMTEKEKEYGVSPYYHPSSERAVSPGEVGLGLDLFALGFYGGICFDEVADFAAGIFLFDFKEDDLRSR